MSKVMTVFLAVLILGNVVGLFMTYKYLRTHRSLQRTQRNLGEAKNTISDLLDSLDHKYSKRMVFLHHSVGEGILLQGGLKDSLTEVGVYVSGATYGDVVGRATDIQDWLPKFRDDLDRILRFKSHFDIYWENGVTNDIVMFKSCFPNSDIVSDGSEPGNPSDGVRSLSSYRAIFEQLKPEFAGKPEKLFVYVTAPPLVSVSTTPENAARARKFNKWIVDEYLPSYSAETGLDNLYVFDLFGLLSDENGYLKEEYRLERREDSHPNTEANRTAAKAFMEQFRSVLTDTVPPDQDPADPS